jgi:hypothetical protein
LTLRAPAPTLGTTHSRGETVKNPDNLPSRQTMRGAHKVRRFRRGNAEHGKAYFGHKQKPWKQHTPTTAQSAA